MLKKNKTSAANIINSCNPKTYKHGSCAGISPILGDVPDIKLSYQEAKDALIHYSVHSASKAVAFTNLCDFNQMPDKMLTYYFRLVVKPEYLDNDPDYGTELEKNEFDTRCNELNVDTDILFLELPTILLNLIKHLIRELRLKSVNVLKQYNLIIAIQHYLFEIKDGSVLKNQKLIGSRNSSNHRRTYPEKTTQELEEGKPILEIMEDEFNIRYSPNDPAYKRMKEDVIKFYSLPCYNPDDRNTTFNTFCKAVKNRTGKPISKQKRYQTLSRAQYRCKKIKI